ncbi:MAG TPA: hypothetical protein VFM19_02770 [Candidatus Limnocylindria bacterium]|nr:hypothetical protein [Candidatus Limnocylindria bacterium]
MPPRIQRPTRDEVSIFPSKSAFVAWMEAHHDRTAALWVGYWRRGIDRPSMTYPESVEVGLAYGWIDSVTYRVDDEVTAIRFTPRRRGSTWSDLNVERMQRLIAAGDAHPAGIAAFEARSMSRT